MASESADGDNGDDGGDEADPAEDSLRELVNYLTPRRDNEMVSTYQNTTAIACPVCDDPFDYLISCKQDEAELSLSTVMDLCVSIDDGQAYLFTHEEE